MHLQIPPQHRESLANILRWVALAVRPLSLDELKGVTKSSDTASISDQLSYCESFLRVKEEKVSLVHHSAKDYLLRTSPERNDVLERFRVNEKAGHLEIARNCFELLNNHLSKFWAPEAMPSIPYPS